MKRHISEMHDTSPEREHPIIGWLAVVAMIVAILSILWLRVAVVGTRDVERTFAVDERSTSETAKRKHPHSLRKKAEDAAAQSRWATGFSH